MAPRMGLPLQTHATNVKEWLRGAPLNERLHRVVGIALPAVLCIIQMWRLRTHTVDDAYITFRYSRNFARGMGLVYNAGEYIEGYTNFLWAVLLAGGYKLGFEPVELAKVLGALSALASLTLVYAISKRLLPLTIAPCIATWLLASSNVFCGYAVFGLETPLFICLVLLGSWLFMREEAGELRGVPWSGAIFALAALTRPEAPMYLGLLMLFMVGKPIFKLPKTIAKTDEGEPEDPIQERAVIMFSCILTAAVLIGVLISMRERSTLMTFGGGAVMVISAMMVLASLPRTMFGKRNLIRGGLFVAPIVLHVLWRHSYYGEWLPNTLVAKTGDMAQQIAGGVRYVLGYVEHEGPVIYLALFGVAMGLVKKRVEMLALGAITICGAIYIVSVGGDWMTLYRFCAPLQPFLFLLIGVATRELLERRSRMVNYGFLMFAMVVVANRSHRLAQDTKQVLLQEKDFWDSAAGGVSEWFIEQVDRRGDEAVRGAIAVGDMGQIGYRTDFPILDLLGLVDPVIAKLPGGYTNKVGEGFRNHFFDSKPRYFILISGGGNCKNPSVIGSKVLYADSRFRKTYKVSGEVRLKNNFLWCVYEHVDFTGG